MVIRDDPTETRFPIPATIDAPLTLCLEMAVPNDPTYLEHLFGTLAELTSAWNYANDAAHSAQAVADKWKRSLSTAEIHTGECSQSMLLRACTTDCGIEYSTDGGETWTCINLNGCIADIVTQGIDGAISDGILERGTVQQGPKSAPPMGSCYTYAVRLEPGSQWHCPSPVKGTDTIQITDATGGWSIGELAWYCPNGDRFLLGICDDALHSHVSGDLLNPGAWHMALIGQIGETYFDPLTALYTVPAGTELSDLFIMANTGLTGVPSGQVEFNVTVCTGVSWCMLQDFASGDQGYEAIDPDTHYGDFSGHNQWGAPEFFSIGKRFVTTEATRMDSVVLNYFTSGPRLIQWQIYDNDAGEIVAINTAMSGATVHGLGPVSLPPGDYTFRLDCHDNAGVTLSSIRLTGGGTNPFGEDNCT